MAPTCIVGATASGNPSSPGSSKRPSVSQVVMPLARARADQLGNRLRHITRLGMAPAIPVPARSPLALSKSFDTMASPTFPLKAAGNSEAG